MNKTTQSAKIVKAIELAWDSLNSHLYFSIEPPKVSKKAKPYVGGRRFHRQCVKDYAVILQTLTELL